MVEGLRLFVSEFSLDSIRKPTTLIERALCSDLFRRTQCFELGQLLSFDRSASRHGNNTPLMKSYSERRMTL
jgi:hypothetical protein